MLFAEHCAAIALDKGHPQGLHIRLADHRR